MNVNRRTVTLIVVVLAVVVGVYAITRWQRARETRQLLEDLRSPNHAVANRALTGLRDRTEAVSDTLIEYLDSADDNTRWRAAMLLGTVKTRASRDALIDALDDESPDVRLNAALSLGHGKARGAAERIAMLAQNPAEPLEVRMAAVEALQMLASATHVAEISSIAADRPPVPEPVEEGAEEAEDAAEAEPVEDETEELRQRAVDALARLGAAEPVRAEGTTTRSVAMKAVETLRDSVDPTLEPSAQVRQAAAYALGDLARLVTEEEVRTIATNALIDACSDEVGNVRIAAVHSLRLISPPLELVSRVNETLEDALNDDHYWVREAAREAVAGG